MCACPSNPDAMRFGVPWGFGHRLGGGEPALLGLPSLSSSLTCFLLTPLPTSCSPWLGQAGQALGVSSLLPARGKGVAVGQEREGTPFCSALWLHTAPVPRMPALLGVCPWGALCISLSSRVAECGEPTEPPCTPGLSAAAGWRKC